jgi:N-acetylglucosamine kinase-like BadF-type ATPase
MKAKDTTERTLSEYLQDARDAAIRSTALWQPVNTAIAGVLEHAIHYKYSGKWVSNRLAKMAGAKQRGEPVALDSYRSAARQIASGAQKLTLI